MRLARAAILALVACGGAEQRPAAPAQAEPAVDPRIDVANLQARLTPYVEAIGKGWGEAYQFSGFVLVAAADQPLYAQGFGYADRAAKRPNTADTSFRVGSVTKQFTAAAILQLEEQGKLSVDDPISKHIPEYPEPGADVTIHQLLTHTGGIPSYTDDAAFMATRANGRSVQQMLEVFWRRPLAFTPGSQFRYSNSGYIVLGAIIERASGMTYADYLRSHVFEPAGLTRTAVGDAPGLDDRARGYAPEGDGLAGAPPIDMSVPFAAGAVRSTANDLARWHRALESGVIIDESSRRKLYAPERDDYAYGWVVTERDGHRFIGHGGGIDGFLTSYVRVMDLDLVVVVWSNNAAVDTEPIADAAVRAALGEAVEPPEEPTRVALDPALPPRVTGTWQISKASLAALGGLQMPQEVIDSVRTIEIAAADGGLTFDPVGQPALRLAPTGAATFAIREAKVTVVFEVEAGSEAPATRMSVTQGGLTLDYEPAPASD